MRGKFRWLHLSDIHYMTSPDTTNMQKNLYEELERYFGNNPHEMVDCIVITGDFLQHGQYVYRDEHDCIKFIEELCKKCLRIEYRTSWKQHIFFCPGNHDLNRNANLNDERGKKVYKRNEVLKDMVELSPDQMSNSKTEEYNLLTKESFWLFDKTIGKAILGNSYKNYGEYRIFKGDVAYNQDGGVFDIKDEKYQVIFVGLNTALYAGQMRDKEDIKREIDERRKDLEDAERNNFLQNQENSYEKAIESYRNYLRLHYELIEGEANDKGKLCFISDTSKNAVTKSIKKIESDSGKPVVVLFGHHPLEWLTENAQKELANWAKHSGYESKLYLCGHEHKPKLQDFLVKFDGDASYKLVEIGVGGEFADKSEWNILSYSLNTITFEESGDAVLSGMIGCLCKYIDDELIKYTNKRTYGWQYFDFNGIKLKSAETMPDLEVQNIIEQQKYISDIRKEEQNIISERKKQLSKKVENSKIRRIVYTADMLDSNLDF